MQDKHRNPLASLWLWRPRAAPSDNKARPHFPAKNILCKLRILHSSSRYKTLLRLASFLFLSCLVIVSLCQILSHNINLDIPSLCAINQKLHSHPSHHRHRPFNATKFSILTFVDGPALSAIASHYPGFVESRSIYASLHGYTLRMYFHRADTRRPLVWSKILAVHDIFYPNMEMAGEESSDVEEWVWVLDLDALIFNFGVTLESVVESASSSGNDRRGRAIDIIIACDHNGLNAGSFLVRKSEWTREFLKRWWLGGEDKGIPMIDKLFEQAVLTELVRTDKAVAAHVHIAPMRDFNAYGYPAGEAYLFRPGDFIVHCPGPTLKKWLPAYARQWERMMQDCKLREMWMDAGMALFEAQAAAANR